MDQRSDLDLLRRFSREGDEKAFEKLVERHAPMVRGVSLRCTGDPALATEITQSVFTLLARKAGTIAEGHLSGWLHNAAFLEARNVTRKSGRYRRVLQELNTQTDMNSFSSEDPEQSCWADVRVHLDEAISQLPEKARHPVMLRYFERKSIREIAWATGKSEDASRKELQRSLQQLGEFLRKKGIVTTSTALSAMLAGQNLLAPPASAAAISAAALEAAGTWRAASAITHAVKAAGAGQTLKTALIALGLALIPTAMLWHENRSLSQELAGFKNPASASAGNGAEKVEASELQDGLRKGARDGRAFEDRLRELLGWAAGPQRTYEIYRLFEEWVRSDAVGAFSHTAKIADIWLRRELSGRMIGWWAESSPEEAWEFAGKNLTGDLPWDAREKAIIAMGRADAGKVLSFFESHGESDLGRGMMFAGMVLGELYERGHSAVLMPWVENLPEGRLKDQAVGRIIEKWALYEPEKAKEWMERNAQSEGLQSAREALAEAWVKVNPAAALKWIDSMGDGGRKGELYTRAIGRWIDADINAAGEWLATQTPSSTLDGAFERYAFKVMGQNPADTMPWAESIADEVMRQRTMERVAMVWSRRDPQGLQDYVARGAFSEEEKRRLLKPEPQGEGAPFPGWLGQPPRGAFPPKEAGPDRH